MFCSVIYNRFHSVIAQIPTTWQIVPFIGTRAGAPVNDNLPDDNAARDVYSPYEFEPDEEAILAALLPRNLGSADLPRNAGQRSG